MLIASIGVSGETERQRDAGCGDGSAGRLRNVAVNGFGVGAGLTYRYRATTVTSIAWITAVGVLEAILFSASGVGLFDGELVAQTVRMPIRNSSVAFRAGVTAAHFDSNIACIRTATCVCGNFRVVGRKNVASRSGDPAVASVACSFVKIALVKTNGAAGAVGGDFHAGRIPCHIVSAGKMITGCA